MKRNRQSGVTLIEMLIVVTIVALLAGIAVPGVTSGLDRLRLVQASDSVVAFLNSGLNRAERRQEPVEITIDPKQRSLSLRGRETEKKLTLPTGVEIRLEETRRFLLLPGTPPPRLGLELANARGVRRVVSIDPLTGTPQITEPEVK
ncbi:MAG: pilus assembly FimT family protein [Bryobacteraceae bacterium]